MFLALFGLFYGRFGPFLALFNTKTLVYPFWVKFFPDRFCRLSLSGGWGEIPVKSAIFWGKKLVKG